MSIRKVLLIRFDKIFQTVSGFVAGMEICPSEDDMATPMLDPGQKIHLSDLHWRVGHAHEESVRQTAREYSWEVMGSNIKCDNCGLDKAHKKSASDHAERSKHKVERRFLDISSVTTTSFGGSNFWLVIVDDYSDYSWNCFLMKKSSSSKPLVE